jgi:hypothetical protein
MGIYHIDSFSPALMDAISCIVLYPSVIQVNFCNSIDYPKNEIFKFNTEKCSVLWFSHQKRWFLDVVSQH